MDPAQRSPYQFMMRNEWVRLDDLARAATTANRLRRSTFRIEALDRSRSSSGSSRQLSVRISSAHTATGMVAREVVEEYGTDVGQHPVGTGPYMLTSWTPAPGPCST